MRMLHGAGSRVGEGLFLACLALLAALPVGAQQRELPYVIQETVLRFGLPGHDRAPRFNTFDYPDQNLVRATYEGYTAGSQRIAARTTQGERLEFYLDPQRSRICRADGSPLALEEIRAGAEVVLSASGREERRTASRLLLTGDPPEVTDAPPDLDAVPVSHPGLGWSVRPPRGWRGAAGDRDALLFLFEPRSSRSRLQPRLVILRDRESTPTEASDAPRWEPLGSRDRKVGPTTVREGVSAVLLADQLVLMHLQRLEAAGTGPLFVVGYSLPEEFSGHLAGFRAVADQVAAR